MNIKFFNSLFLRHEPSMGIYFIFYNYIFALLNLIQSRGYSMIGQREM